MDFVTRLSPLELRIWSRLRATRPTFQTLLVVLRANARHGSTPAVQAACQGLLAKVLAQRVQAVQALEPQDAPRGSLAVPPGAGW
jgi:hypothetical protein